MTRYSASRGIRYTAPPGPSDERNDGVTAPSAEADEETTGERDGATADD